jgi:hypothetical protein
LDLSRSLAIPRLWTMKLSGSTQTGKWIASKST